MPGGSALGSRRRSTLPALSWRSVPLNASSEATSTPLMNAPLDCSGPLRKVGLYSAGETAVTCGTLRIRATMSCQFSIPSPGVRGTTLMCAIAPSRLRCSVLRKPLVTASATTSAVTPAATPSTEIAVITEITASLRRARR